jgi:hypothetical protein
LAGGHWSPPQENPGDRIEDFTARIAVIAPETKNNCAAIVGGVAKLGASPRARQIRIFVRPRPHRGLWAKIISEIFQPIRNKQITLSNIISISERSGNSAWLIHYDANKPSKEIMKM